MPCVATLWAPFLWALVPCWQAGALSAQFAVFTDEEWHGALDWVQARSPELGWTLKSTPAAPAPASHSGPCPTPAVNTAMPGTSIHHSAFAARTETTGWRVAIGRSCRLAPIAVVAQNPLVMH